MTNVPVESWETLMASLGGGKSNVYYVKEGKTTIRLVYREADNPLMGGPKKFWVDTVKNYQGKVSTAFVVRALVLKTSKDGDNNISSSRVRYCRLTVGQLQGILGALQEDHDLFDPENGKAVVVTKVVKGDNTSYMVQASAKSVPINLDSLEWPDVTIIEAAKAEAEAQEARGAGDDNKASDNPAAKPRNKVKAANLDDDDIPF